MSATRRLDEGEVFVWTIEPNADWHHSKFPDPLITVDYDANDRPFQIVAIGPKAAELERVMRDGALARLRDTDDPEIAADVERVLATA